MSDISNLALPLAYMKDLLPLKQYLELNIFDEYRMVNINHHVIKIPYRIYNKPLITSQLNELNQYQKLIYFCIFTRHYNGYVRHDMVKKIMQTHAVLKEGDLVIPYIFLLLGEYVAEICEELYPYIKANKSVIRQFIHQNKELSHLTYQRSVSY